MVSFHYADYVIRINIIDTSYFLLNIRLVRKDENANDHQVKLLEATTTFCQVSELEATQHERNGNNLCLYKRPK